MGPWALRLGLCPEISQSQFVISPNSWLNYVNFSGFLVNPLPFVLIIASANDDFICKDMEK